MAQSQKEPEPTRDDIERARIAQQDAARAGVLGDVYATMQHSGAKIGTPPDHPGEDSVEPHPSFKLAEPAPAPAPAPDDVQAP